MAEEGAGAGAVSGEVIRAGRLVAALAVLAVAGCAAVTPPPRTGESPMGVCGRVEKPQLPDEARYLIFFEPDSAVVSPRAKQILSEMTAFRARRGNDGNVIAIGHIDPAEAKRTRGLDYKRADATRSELIADGIPAGSIQLLLRGANDPLVPTDKAESEDRYVSFYFPGLGGSDWRKKQFDCGDWIRWQCIITPHPTASPEACEKALNYVLPPL